MKSTYYEIEKLPLSLTVDDIGMIMGLSRKKAYDLCHSKGFPCVNVGRRMVIPKFAFIKWMESPLLGNAITFME